MVLSREQLLEADPHILAADRQLGAGFQARRRGCFWERALHAWLRALLPAALLCSPDVTPSHCALVQGLHERERNYIRRNWFQVRQAQAVYAVGRITQ